jgi:hypothetical protein
MAANYLYDKLCVLYSNHTVLSCRDKIRWVDMHGVKFESDDEKKRLVNKRLYEHIAENVVL